MKKDIEINELIESFLKGTLPEEDMRHISDRMERDASFARQVETHRQLHGVITDSIYLGVRNELKNVHLNKMRTARNIRRITGFGSAGLIVGLAVFFLVTRNNGTGDKLPENDQTIMEQPATVQPTTEQPAPEQPAPMQPAVAQPIRERLASPPADTVNGTAKDTSAAGNGMDIPSATSNEDTEEGTVLQRSEDDSSDTKTDTNAQLKDEAGAENELEQAAAEGRGEQGTSPDNGNAAGEAKTPLDCNDVFIEASLITEASCNNEPTGRIMVDGQTLRGGVPPYSFSLNGSTFTGNPVFSALFPGNYPVYARDAAGCINSLGNVVVRTEDCTYQYVFAPMRGDVWNVPVKDDATGILIIYSKEGNVVYRVPVSSDEEAVWSGNTVSGQGLEMGLYQFEIRYDDGTRFSGTVTLVR